MPSMNKAIIIGHLGKDPEVRSTTTGKQVANFSVATSERFTSKDGTKNTKTEWHNIVAWGRNAEVCERYLHKGDPVMIEGSIQTRKWEDREGNTRYSTEILVQRLQLMGGKRSDGPAEQTPDDDDCPF